MKVSLPKPFWRGLVVCVITLGGLIQGSQIPVQSGAAVDLPAALSAAQIIIEEPELTPSYQGMCESAWHRYTNDRGNYAYLTLNAQASSGSTNSGKWRPALPQAGYYLVEAYIPAHPSLYWDCPSLKKWISWDTSNARYTIQHALGQSSVSLNQAPLNNQWVRLGAYAFSAGQNGYVELSDLTGEENVKYSVSFSAMRFTLLNSMHLPLLTRNPEPVFKLTNIWMADSSGSQRDAFIPGETIRFYGSGFNGTEENSSVKFTWSISGPCGSSTLYDGNKSIQPGTWLEQQSSAASTCLGVYQYTLRVNHNGTISSLQLPFVITNPSEVTVSNQQGFDRCNIPTTGQMQTWWTSSPYHVINLYMGGVSRTCANSGLDSVWVATVSQQGWKFIPTWVGPQAPCSRFQHRMSPNATTAYQQGRGEADAAVQAAIRLGFEGDMAIYYDMEGYPNESSCRNTVKSFLKGWNERLLELGVRSGVYGSPCTSYVSDWASITPAPDNVWIASWVAKTYDPNATVWGASCLSDSLWANHQRLRQYAGDHTETWGGLSLTIDSNVLDGQITTIPGYNRPALLHPAEPADLARPSEIQATQLLSAGQGWALVDGRLLWTANTGHSWRDITPASAAAPGLAAVFLDEEQGWLVVQNPKSGQVELLKTGDGGAGWQSYTVTNDAPESQSGPVRAAAVHFLDSQTGWISVRISSSSNFSLGRLFATQDGGQTWSERTLPVWGAVSFVDARRGWVAGGAAGSQLYRTEDGGQNWHQESFAATTGTRSGQFGQHWVSLPVFGNDQAGFLSVTVADPAAPRVEIYATQDRGETWSLAGTIPLRAEALPGSLLPVALTGQSRWVMAAPAGEQLYTIESAGRPPEQRAAPGLPDGVVELEFVTPSAGWARVQQGSCSGVKPAPGVLPSQKPQAFQCSQQSQLLMTLDAGQTWVNVTP